MAKNIIEIDSLGGIGMVENGNCLVMIYTNYGVLMYDSGIEKFLLNDIEISSDDFELENAYREVIKAMSYTIKMYAPKRA